MRLGFVIWMMGAVFGAVLTAGCAGPKDGGALIATATNFRGAFEALEADFESRSAHEISGVFGGTGQLYLQIINGAEYDAFLAADQLRPERLMTEAQAAARARFTYAVGALALWTRRDSALAKEFTPSAPIEDVLQSGAGRTLAIANPKLAPYGRAAREALDALSLSPPPRIVQGENAGQAFALAATGNAQAGLIAKADALKAQDGVYWDVPPALHTPILQDAVLLRGGANPAAKAFFTYLQSEEARRIMAAYGYATPETGTPQDHLPKDRLPQDRLPQGRIK